MVRLHWSAENASAAVPDASSSGGRLAKLERAEKVLHLIWVIVGAAAVFSLLTGGPWAAHFMPKGWGPAGFLLPVIVDISLVIAVNLTAAATYLGEKPGGWLSTLRWITVLATIFLNIGDSAEKKDLTGVAIHAIIPALLTAATAGEIWFRRKVGEVRSAEIERAERDRVNARREDREQQERERRERLQRAEQERRERLERENRERADRLAEAERKAQIERERDERAAAIERARIEAQERQAEAERKAQIEREKIEAQERQAKAALQAQIEQQERERAEQAAREQRAHELRVAEHQAAAAIERERLEHERLEKEARRKHELSLARAASRAGPPEDAPKRSRDRSRERAADVHEGVHGTVHEPAPEDRERLSEEEAIKIIENTPNASVRTLAQITGWSLGWISNQRKAVSATANGSNSERKEE